MKLFKWKEEIKKEIDNLHRWDDAELVLSYYLIESKDRQKKRRGIKKEIINWWGGLNSTKKMKFVEKLHEVYGDD